jgi:DHA2 family multidrug resistance protein
MSIGACFGFLRMSGALIIPNFLSTIGSLKAEQSGRLLWVVVVLQIAFMPLAYWLMQRIDTRIPLAIGVLAFIAACLMGTRITHEWLANYFLPMLVLFAFGSALTFLGVMTVAVSNARPPETLQVIAFAQIPRVLRPTFASAMISTFLTQFERVHSALLVPYADPTRSVIRAMQMSGGAISDLSEVIQREANVLDFRDAYELCAVVGCVTPLCSSR